MALLGDLLPVTRTEDGPDGSVPANGSWRPVGFPSPVHLPTGPNGLYVVLPGPNQSEPFDLGLGLWGRLRAPFPPDQEDQAVTVTGYVYLPLLQVGDGIKVPPGIKGSSLVIGAGLALKQGVKVFDDSLESLEFRAEIDASDCSSSFVVDVYCNGAKPPHPTHSFSDATTTSNGKTLPNWVNEILVAHDEAGEELQALQKGLNGLLRKAFPPPLPHEPKPLQFSVGNLLVTAKLLTPEDTQTDGPWQVEVTDWSKLEGKTAADFMFWVLEKLAARKDPIIPVGKRPNGIYVVGEDAGDGKDYGLRVVAQDIALSGGEKTGDKDSGEQDDNDDGDAKPKRKIDLQLGKWLSGEDDDTSWVKRTATAQPPAPREPGLSLFLVHQDGGSAVCRPRAELVSAGLDVKGTADQPLFDKNGYVLSGFEGRVLVRQGGDGVLHFGGAAKLDGLGVPLGPGFGKSTQGTDDKVAQSLLSSGSDEGGDAKSGGDQAPVNPSFSLSVAYFQKDEVVVQLYDKDGKPTDVAWIPIQRALGPLHCDKIGLGWKQEERLLSLLFDGGISRGELDVDFINLSVGVPVEHPGDFSQYKLGLDGFGLTYSAPPVELSAALLRVPPKGGNGPAYAEYDGEAFLKAKNFGIGAIGSYAWAGSETDGYASLFILGILDRALGGPPYFYVTGVAAGFGLNRAIVLPALDKVPEFPLVAAASDPTKLGGKPPSPAKALAALHDSLPAERGEYWLAAGVNFTSYELVKSTALLSVEFGTELEIGLLGLSSIKLAEGPLTLAYGELGLEAKLVPSKGVFGASAVLAPNSFVLDPACKLTGGFAFYVWFGDSPLAGQFVVTLGGYHPDFKPPAGFPRVPRLGFRWPLPGNVTISGQAYCALTASAIMAGGSLEILFAKGNFKAWFKAQADLLMEWAPVLYEAYIAVSIGVSYRLHLLFVTTTLKAELGANLTLWGPKTGGQVEILWYIISVTVQFGAARDQGPKPLSWPDFARRLLPPNSLSITAGAGVLGEVQDDEDDEKTVWIVRPDLFQFSAGSAVPADTVVFGARTFGPGNRSRADQEADQGQYFVGIRPMKTILTSSKLTVTIDEHESFQPTLATRNVPAALWGSPDAGLTPAADLLRARLVGVENVRAGQPPLKGQIDVDVENAFTYDVVDVSPEGLLGGADPHHLPLPPAWPPARQAERADPDVVARVTTLKGVRSGIFDALRGLGLDPQTDGALDVLAADPLGVLGGSPLLEDAP